MVDYIIMNFPHNIIPPPTLSPMNLAIVGDSPSTTTIASPSPSLTACHLLLSCNPTLSTPSPCKRTKLTPSQTSMTPWTTFDEYYNFPSFLHYGCCHAFSFVINGGCYDSMMASRSSSRHHGWPSRWRRYYMFPFHRCLFLFASPQCSFFSHSQTYLGQGLRSRATTIATGNPDLGKALIVRACGYRKSSWSMLLWSGSDENLVLCICCSDEFERKKVTVEKCFGRWHTMARQREVDAPWRLQEREEKMKKRNVLVWEGV